MRFLFGVAFVMAVALAAMAAGRADNLQSYKRPTHITFPADAPYSPQIAALGKMLFFDPRLSGAQNMSCSTCHNPSFGWETPVELAIGSLNVALPRHAPTVENLIDAPALRWDGSAATLEEQAIGPITHPEEMNSTLYEIEHRLYDIERYRTAFDVAFPETGLNPNNILRALATYERTLLSGRSPFDDWVNGDEAAISDSAKRGFDLFVGQAQCGTCHSGWAFTNHTFNDIGLLTEDPGQAGSDGETEVTRHAFKTPGLRNIALRAPYMHHGEIANLSDVVAHYNRGGHPLVNRERDIVPLGLTAQEASDLVAFLQTLTAVNPHISQPALPAR